MKKIAFILIFAILAGIFGGCSLRTETAEIAATTLPVYQFTSWLVNGTGLTVTRLVTENVSCLHDYSLHVGQVMAAEAAELIVINGAGLEDFMEDLLQDKQVIDSSVGIELLESCGDHGHDGHGHEHAQDPHIWLSVSNAKAMVHNIYQGLCRAYPQHRTAMEANLETLLDKLDALESYATEKLQDLSCRKMITFHDGFAYFAQSLDLEILATVEEESGSEASSKLLIELIELVRAHDLPGIFIEANGADAAARTICAETDTHLYILNMAMAGDDYFAAMYHNIDTLREALE